MGKLRSKSHCPVCGSNIVCTECADLKRQLADYEDDFRATMNEVCEGSDDRKHCSCVPYLRQGLIACNKMIEEFRALLPSAPAPGKDGK